ncbi:MAG: serine/threonine-protein kinase [Vulcanimicrobiota bacterium]
MGRVLAALLVVLLSGPAWARMRTLEVVTHPPGAVVKDQFGNVLGRSGTPLAIDPDHYDTRQVQLHLSLPGYKASRYAYLLSDSDQGRIPPSGAIVLEPASLWVRVRDGVRYQSWTVLVAGLLLAVGGLGLRHRHRLRHHQEWLERYQGGAAADSLILTELGGYRLVQEVGHGGMATVYRAVPADSLDEKAAVAIKVLDRKLAQRPEFVDRFRREIEVSRWLVHPAVVKILDWGEERGYLYLVMEFVDGQNLRDHMQQPLSLAEAVALLEPIMAGVHYAHRRGVVHRDLKPENIMLTRSGKPKVMDFGLARELQSQKLTKTGTAMGTPAYMSPEQIRGDELHPACDQYGLGVLAFELLTGRLPFDGDPMQLMFCHMSEDPPPPSRWRPELPPALDEVVLRMLDKEAENRYPDLEQASRALGAALEESAPDSANHA